MTKYCGNCGKKLNDDADFCTQCGTSQKEEKPSKNNNNIIIIGLLGLIIIILVAFLAFGMKTSSELIITSSPTLTTDDDFAVRLTSNGTGIANQEIHVVFDDNGKAFEFDTVTDENGKASFEPNLDVGKYEVACKFGGNAKYKDSYDTMTVNIKENEPDYESYSYPRSFASTDTNGDGYVLLSDMNIAHTPQNIQYQMYADADDNNDGKLNEHEYYKFMYKLNYDKQSYGL
ncbi:zinc-ribbon domain-containing protein [Methanobrevibacter sp.]|uniref:zinc-ribbon domain-containing protein n=1 Tax=Methanobrevibacter sp. TaxID=66852 RepID=UPI00386E8D5C